LNLHDDYVKKISIVFDASIFQDMFKEMWKNQSQYIYLPNGRRILNGPMPSGNPPLVNESPEAITALVASTHFLYSNTFGMENNALKARESAINLIQLLQKHYHLE
jgi:hypothetical protein